MLRPFSHRRRNSTRRRLSFESLERRELLTATLQSVAALSLPVGGIGAGDVVSDAAGNTYFSGSLNNDSGQFAGPLDFDLANSYPDNRDIIGAEWTTSFIAKYDATGAFVWVQASTPVLNEVGQPGNGGFNVARLAVGASGDVYFTGVYSGVTEFGGKTTPFNGEYRDGRLVGRLDSAGNAVWLIGLDLAAIEWDANNIAVDEARNRVFLAGNQMLTNPGNYSVVAVALNTADSNNINVAWTATVVPTPATNHPYVTCNDMVLDATGAVYVGGAFRGSADFDPGTGKQSLSSGSGGRFDTPSSGFVWKLTSDGKLARADVFQANSGASSSVKSLVIDAANNLIVAGNFSGTVDFQPGKGTVNLAYNGSDIFLAKFTPTGTLLYAKSMVSVGNEYVNDITLDAVGNIYIAGTRSNSSTDGAFVATFNANGIFQSQTLLIGATVYTPRLSWNRGTGKLHVVGSFASPLDANGDGNVDVTSDGSTDFFWATYGV